MKPPNHVITSLVLGAGLWFFTKSFYAGLLCFASGIFVDADHIIEYAVHYGWKNLTYKNIYETSLQTGRREGGKGFSKLHLVFHLSEVAVALWVATIYTGNVYFLAVALGYSSHLILDCIANPQLYVSYFMFWRAIKKFETKRLLKKRR